MKWPICEMRKLHLILIVCSPQSQRKDFLHVGDFITATTAEFNGWRDFFMVWSGKIFVMGEKLIGPYCDYVYSGLHGRRQEFEAGINGVKGQGTGTIKFFVFGPNVDLIR